MPAVPYSASRIDLFFPCRRGDFFLVGMPDSEAAICVEMCRLAYCRASSDFALDQAKIQTVLSGVGFSESRFFETQGSPSHRGTHGFLAYNRVQNLAVLAFRGTDKDDPSDLTDDANFTLQPWEKGGNVHTGFADALADVRPALEQALPTIGSRLLITGHSLGAAIATLLASAWNPVLHSRIALYTFGSPKVGDASFVATIPGTINHRYVDCCDVVTRVPLSIMGYEHVGDPLYIDRDGTITPNPGDDFIAADKRRATEEYLLHYFGRAGTVAVRELADHAPINYVSALTGTRT